MTDLNTLARQLVEHPRWTWQRGMVDCFGTAVSGTSRTGNAWFTRDEWDSNPDCLPDIENPGTKGWLLHMLREAGGHRLAAINAVCFERGAGSHAGPVWGVNWDPRRVWSFEPTEGAALAAALLAVWGAT